MILYLLSSFSFGFHATVALHLCLTYWICSRPGHSRSNDDIPNVVVIVDIKVETKLELFNRILFFMNFFFKTHLKNFKRPPASLIRKTFSKPPRSMTPCTMTMATPRNIRIHWRTSVQMTALMPPLKRQKIWFFSKFKLLQKTYDRCVKCTNNTNNQNRGWNGQRRDRAKCHCWSIKYHSQIW